MLCAVGCVVLFEAAEVAGRITIGLSRLPHRNRIVRTSTTGGSALFLGDTTLTQNGRLDRGSNR